MRRTLLLLILGAAVMRPAAAAELQIVSPANKSVVRGAVEFKIRPIDGPRDVFLENPYVEVQDQEGKHLEELRAPRDRATGICTAVLDTSKLKDGLYLITVRYRTLVGGKAQRIEEEMTLGIRNLPTRAGRFTVQFEDKEYKADEAADVKVKVLDARGKPMPGARVAFKTTGGSLESEAEITDSDGEAFISIENEEGQPVTMTITVEGLPPITKVVRFKAPPTQPAGETS